MRHDDFQRRQQAEAPENPHVDHRNVQGLFEHGAVDAEHEIAAADQNHARGRCGVEHHALVDEHRKLVLVRHRPEEHERETAEDERGQQGEAAEQLRDVGALLRLRTGSR